MVMKISARVEIDAGPAKSGSLEASKAVEAIGTSADRAAVQLEKLKQSAASGIRGSMSIVGGKDATAAQEAATAALERLKAKYDPVIAAQLRYKNRVEEIAQAQAAGAVSASQAIDLRMREKASLDALVGSLNNVAAARKASAENAVARAAINPDRGADVAAYGAELDKLRMRFNPLFAVITNYKRVQADIRQAHAVGAISADEMSAALDRQRRSTLASIDAIKGRNKALTDTPSPVTNGSRGFETANLAAQFQDIGVTAAMGMSPLQIALQQGTQLSSIIVGMQNPIRGLAAAFMSVLSPVSLITIGVVAAGAAAIQYFSGLMSNSNDAKSVLEGHAELIRRIKGAYGEAAEGLKEYADESEKLVRQDTADKIKAYREAILDSAKSIRGDLALDPKIFNGATYTIEQMRAAIFSLDQGIKGGKPDLQGFIERLIDIENQSGTPERVREIIREIRTSAKDGIEAQRALNPLIATINGVGATASGQVGNIQAFAKALRELNAIGTPALTDADRITSSTNAALEALRNSGQMNEEARRKLLILQQQARTRLENQNPTVINSDGNQTNIPVPGNKPVTLGDRDRASERSAKTTANAYRDLVKRADDRVAQMKLEAELAGQTGVAADTLRLKLDLLQKGEDKGRSLTASQVEAINQRVEAFKRYAEEAAKATLKADLLFQREQMGRSAMDQQIASSLRSAGLPIDFDSFEAGLIRTNLQLEYARDLAGDFVSTFFDGIRQGKSVWESFGDAGVKALQRIADTLMNDVLNSIFSVSNAGGGSGGGLLSGLFGGLGSLFGGGKFPSAPGGLYDRGGYTGPGGVLEPAGIVHRGEVVWSQRDVARAGGVATVEAMRLGRRGYADGGVVEVAPLMSASRAAAALSQQAQTLQLMVKLGVAVDESGNIMPLIKSVVAEDGRDIAISVVENYDSQMPARMAQIQQDPMVR